jgi:hypothetical protein
MLFVPLLGGTWGDRGGGGVLFVAIVGGVPALIYLFASQTRIGTILGGLGMIGATLFAEAYVASRWPESSTAVLGYLWLPVLLLPGVALLLLGEGLLQQIREPGSQRTGATVSLVGASIAGLLGSLFYWVFLNGAWPLASTALLIITVTALALGLRRR